MLAMLGSIASQGGYPVPVGTNIYLPLDGNFLNKINGSVAHTIYRKDNYIYYDWQAGKFGNSLRISSKGWAQWIEILIPLTIPVNLSKISDWTFQCWFKMYGHPAENPKRNNYSYSNIGLRCDLVHIQGESTVANYIMGARASGTMECDENSCYSYDLGSAISAYNKVQSEYNGTITQFSNKFYFIRIVKTGTNIALYVDGVLRTFNQIGSIIDFDATQLRITSNSYAEINGAVTPLDSWIMMDDILFVPTALPGTEVPLIPYS